MSTRKHPVTLLTGGTGFLGSHIGAELLKRGAEVIFLVRGKNKLSGSARLAKILDWHGIDSSLRSGVRLIDGPLENPLSGVDRFIHCLSDTSFSERNRDRVWTTNVDSLERFIDFAVRSRIPWFIYISTAYVAGKRRGPCSEEPVDSKDFHNVYEESKAAAEGILLKRCKKERIRLTVVRPSIVYGDSRTGRTFSFNALYYPIKTALFLSKIFIEDIREKGGQKAAEAGVVLEPDGGIRLPLRIKSCDKCGVNLIPVDFFIDAFFALIEGTPPAEIYHIVNFHPTKIADIIRYGSQQFKLEGIRSCSPEEFQEIPPNSMERLYERYLQAYLPYITDSRVFLTDKSSPILTSRKITCPEFDETMFRLCMSYAVTNNWQSL